MSLSEILISRSACLTEQFVRLGTYESDNDWPSSCLNQTSWSFWIQIEVLGVRPTSNGNTIGFNAPGALVIRLDPDTHT